DLIAKELAAYSDEVTEEEDKIAEQVADETVDELKETSPKRYGKYRRSWKKKKLANGSFVVLNAVKPHFVNKTRNPLLDLVERVKVN
ncbi:HK97 gp10 family phage protein, partial [Streptococcus pneumoniae]|uniref:HK97 gp10 family phage protein n=1 Tax=Streptococcus pneumoniae TaxID=1313 RepID=UPI001EFDFADB